MRGLWRTRANVCVGACACECVCVGACVWACVCDWVCTSAGCVAPAPMPSVPMCCRRVVDCSTRRPVLEANMAVRLENLPGLNMHAASPEHVYPLDTVFPAEVAHALRGEAEQLLLAAGNASLIESLRRHDGLVLLSAACPRACRTFCLPAVCCACPLSGPLLHSCRSCLCALHLLNSFTRGVPRQQGCVARGGSGGSWQGSQRPQDLVRCACGALFW